MTPSVFRWFPTFTVMFCLQPGTISICFRVSVID